ncbi:shikimate dehydrogenase [Ekhidna lutea]|uniref:Shikimate dehydrogenase n=1 Tax=Ekhidna lutea TaxID=447679 RepID=A0A239KF30_EKHLU|nr:shikimate dehydrogenase [Ekhidna lutea]SNT16791.1 shikimate dehydrogenase [Ekhidna lutea]
MKRFGLIGYPVGHSFSQRFFQDKFKKLKLKDHVYDLFEMEFLNEFPALWMKYKDLVGVNVTVPHKEKVVKYLDKLDASAIKVGAANVIYKNGGKLIGYNSDYMAFRESLRGWIGKFKGEALILGSGGASKAIQAGLTDLNIPYNQVSRTTRGGDYTYDQLKANPEIVSRFKLIVNTTPLGMHPNVDTFPDIPYKNIQKGSYLYDLIYNPAETNFLVKGKSYGAKTKNGLEMLELQAEKSWDIWSE